MLFFKFLNIRLKIYVILFFQIFTYFLDFFSIYQNFCDFFLKLNPESLLYKVKKQTLNLSLGMGLTIEI